MAPHGKEAAEMAHYLALCRQRTSKAHLPSSAFARVMVHLIISYAQEGKKVRRLYTFPGHD